MKSVFVDENSLVDQFLENVRNFQNQGLNTFLGHLSHSGDLLL